MATQDRKPASSVQDLFCPRAGAIGTVPAGPLPGPRIPAGPGGAPLLAAECFAGLYGPEPAVDPRLPFVAPAPAGGRVVEAINGLPGWLFAQKGPLRDLGSLGVADWIPRLGPAPEIVPGDPLEQQRRDEARANVGTVQPEVTKSPTIPFGGPI